MIGFAVFLCDLPCLCNGGSCRYELLGGPGTRAPPDDVGLANSFSENGRYPPPKFVREKWAADALTLRESENLEQVSHVL